MLFMQPRGFILDSRFSMVDGIEHRERMDGVKPRMDGMVWWMDGMALSIEKHRWWMVDGVDGNRASRIEHREAADGWDGVDGEAADGVSVLCALCVNEAADAWCGGEAADGVDGM